MRTFHDQFRLPRKRLCTARRGLHLFVATVFFTWTCFVVSWTLRPTSLTTFTTRPTTNTTTNHNMKGGLNLPPGSFAPHAPEQEVRGELVVYLDDKQQNPTILCLDQMNGKLPNVYQCHHLGGTQEWSHVQNDHIHTKDGALCLTTAGDVVMLGSCTDGSASKFRRDRYGLIKVVGNVKHNQNQNNTNSPRPKSIPINQHLHAATPRLIYSSGCTVDTLTPPFNPRHHAGEAPSTGRTTYIRPVCV